MSRATSFLGRSAVGLIFKAGWLLVGVLALWQGGLGVVNTPEAQSGPRESFEILTAFGVVALAVSATHGMRGRPFVIVGGFAGLVLALYGVALIVLGSEDVGGLRVALPFGLGAIALGAWTLVEVRTRVRTLRVPSPSS